MAPPKKPSKSDEDNTRRLDREVRDMVATLSHKLNLSAIAKQGPREPSGTGEVEFVDDDDNGIRVLTLVGTNTGATMRTDLSDRFSDNMEVPGVYANSNCQAVNNSIMMNGKYTAEDPGVHMKITEEDGKRKGKKKEHKKEKQVEKSDGKTSEGEE